MYRILIAEDDEIIADSIRNHLVKWDYEVKKIDDFKDVMAQFSDFKPQLVLMDISLPFRNGYYWCTEIRKVSNVPIVFISSAGENMNIVMAINLGADDFIVKPFDLNVLTAKVSAVLRRAFSLSNDSDIIENKGVALNLGEASFTYNSVKCDLTKNELRILQILFENAGKTVSRDAIMIKLWDSDSFIDDNTLTVNINRLRKKLEDAGLSDYVITKKGLGYMVK